MAQKSTGRKKKRKVVVEPEGLAYVKASFNNTKITITNKYGNVVAWASGGTSGYKGSRKSTPFAAQQAAMKAAKEAMDQGMVSVEVRVNGPGSGREAAIRSLQVAGIVITAIKDITPIPHNGCRPPKRRRI